VALAGSGGIGPSSHQPLDEGHVPHLRRPHNRRPCGQTNKKSGIRPAAGFVWIWVLAFELRGRKYLSLFWPIATLHSDAPKLYFGLDQR